MDGRIGPDAPAWRSPPVFPAAERRLRARSEVLAGRRLFALGATAPPETWGGAGYCAPGRWSSGGKSAWRWTSRHVPSMRR